MRPPSVTITDDGGLLLSHLAPWFVSVLFEVPDLLDADQPDAVKRRLYPEPSEDPEQSKEWQKYVHPDLFALLASAREIMQRDLETLSPMVESVPPGLWGVTVQKEHISAWISAMNAARLTLAATYGIEEEDMDAGVLQFEVEPEPDEDAPDADDAEELDSEETASDGNGGAIDEKRLAILKIFLLGDLQGMIIEVKHPPPTGPKIPDSLPPDI